jgi:DNA processing protein
MTSSTFSPKSEREALLILNAVPGIGNRRTVDLIQHLGSARKIFELSSEELANLCGLPEPVFLNLLHFPADEFIKKEEELFRLHDVQVLTYLDKEYPGSLRHIVDAPIVLYFTGAFPENLECSLAIVGSRNASLYGLETAERFARDLAELGVPIISGLARGIDAAAHRGCLKAGGKTVAVLGCGMDVIYPQENRKLFEEIREKGAIVSEFPFGTEPFPYNFPRRNRIVSGLAAGVIVVEANIKSGALITAEFAVEQGKEVFAVPGRIDSPQSGGPHNLIRQGAKLVLSVGDVLEELSFQPVPVAGQAATKRSEPLLELGVQEARLIEILREGERSLDELEMSTGLSISMLLPTLLSLQIRRMVREKPGKVYEVQK